MSNPEELAAKWKEMTELAEELQSSDAIAPGTAERLIELTLELKKAQPKFEEKEPELTTEQKMFNEASHVLRMVDENDFEYNGGAQLAELVIEYFGNKIHVPSPEDWVCPNCGNDQIQHLDWIMTNTNEVIGDNENTDYWCPNCEEHYGRVEKRKDYEASQPCEPCAESKDATCKKHPKPTEE